MGPLSSRSVPEWAKRVTQEMKKFTKQWTLKSFKLIRRKLRRFVPKKSSIVHIPCLSLWYIWKETSIIDDGSIVVSKP
jgi:hypothetical protein